MSMSELDTVIPGLGASLECAQAGTRVVTLLSPADLDPATASGLGLTEGASAVVVIDVEKVYLAKADGDDRFVVGAGLPSVVRAPDGRPGVTIPEGNAPSELRVEVLKHGTTQVINTLLERRGARTALVTTAGFRDILEIGKRADLSVFSSDLMTIDAADIPRARAMLTMVDGRTTHNAL